jgi:hypothetical protein
LRVLASIDDYINSWANITLEAKLMLNESNDEYSNHLSELAELSEEIVMVLCKIRQILMRIYDMPNRPLN